MMSEWSAERRAAWFYHNQHNIERDAYERGVKDAAVAAELAKLRAQNVRPNSDYVDPEFSKDPSVMYTQEHVEAAYNPEVASSGALTVLLWIVIISVLLGLAYILVFRVRWGK